MRPGAMWRRIHACHMRRRIHACHMRRRMCVCFSTDEAWRAEEEDDGNDDPFIVLTETKFSIRYIPVWARYSPLRTRVEAHAITLSP
jgi:hypothetical protein